ncbi:Cgr1 family-domain-containing protein [Aspergillus oleicola]
MPHRFAWASIIFSGPIFRITRLLVCNPVAMSSAAPASSTTAMKSVRKNGKNWHANKKPFRPNGGLTSYAKRVETRKQHEAIKEHEKELREEKEAERQAHIQRIKERRAAKEEKERYEKMAEKMHRKRVERLKRREKRNKMLSS